MSDTVKFKKITAFVTILVVSLTLAQFPTAPVYALEFSTQKIEVPDTDRFGWSVQRIDSDLAVGEPFGDSGFGNVYLFDFDGNLVDTISNPNNGADNFGYSLSALDNMLAVGAPGFGSDKGAVYLYDIDTLHTLLTIPNPSTIGERMGEDGINFLNGDLLVGVSKAENSGQLQAGKIYRFSTSDGSQVQPPYSDLTISAGDLFGRSISVSGGAFLTGSHGALSETGEAFVISSSTVPFSNPNSLLPAGDRYGWATEITPTRYVVAAPNAEVSHSSSEIGTQGLVYLHHITEPFTDTINSPDLDDIVSQDVTDQFGYDLAESDGFLVISAPYDDVEVNGDIFEDAGSVYIYTSNGFFLEKMHNPDPAPNDLFGYSLEVVNGLVVIGAPGDDGNEGAVYYLTVSNEFAVTLEINADPNPVPVGGTTTITYTIKNIGSADLFDASIEITSPTCPSIDGPFVDDDDDGILEANEEWRFTCEVTVTEAFTESIIEDFTSITYFEDIFEDPITITCEDENFDCTDTAEIALLESSITLDISANPSIIYTGQESVVTFTVTNNGNDVRQINEGAVTVDGCSPVINEYPIEIAPQGSIDFECTVTGGLAPIDIIAQIVTVDLNNQNPVTVDGIFTINVLVIDIDLDISADPDPTYTGEDTLITYTVTNIGVVPVTIDFESDIVEENPDCIPTTLTALPAELEQNEFIAFTCNVTAGASPLEFSATVTATAENDSEVTASDTLTVNIIAPQITLDISSDPNSVPSGSTSLITYTVTNTGDSPVTIDGETGVSEEGTSGCVPFAQTGIITLQPNDVVNFTCTVTAGFAPIDFDGTATAFDVNDREVTASDQHILDVIPNIVLSGIIRDFKISHPDFEFIIADDDGIVKVDLGGDSEPLYNGNPFTGTVTTTGLLNYNQWYNHVNTINACTTFDITLEPSTANPGYFTYTNTSFFPIDGQLFGNEGNPHNFHFTYQIHATFVYQTGQTITMTGDDDIWVFIDNKLALDQGGVQPPRTGTINLDTLGLTPGETYNFDLFFAERHTTQSNLGIETNIPLIPSTPQQCDVVDAVNDSVFATVGPNTINVTNNDVGFSSIFAFSQPIHGSVTQAGTSLVYTPDLGFEGIDLFTYTIVNNSGDTDTAVVTVIALTDGICPSTPESYNLIMGDNGNNVLRGTNGNDLILGMGGNDKIHGKKGNDCLVGGDGNDKIWGSDGNDTIIAGNGNDQIHGQKGDDTMFGGSGDDKVYGGQGNDTINAGAGNDRVHANQGNDIITGGDGNDWIGAGIGNDTVTAGAGNDKIFGRPGNDILNGEAGDDYIHGGQGDDTVNSGDGKDKIFGHQGHDTLNGDNGDDYIHGGQGNDSIDGGADTDRCNGAQGNNTIINCEIEDKKMKEEHEENDDDEGESESEDDDDDNGNHGNGNNGNNKGKNK